MDNKSTAYVVSARERLKGVLGQIHELEMRELDYTCDTGEAILKSDSLVVRKGLFEQRLSELSKHVAENQALREELGKEMDLLYVHIGSLVGFVQPQAGKSNE